MGATRGTGGSALVIIGAGFIGSRMAEAAVAEGRTVRVLTRSRPALHALSGATVITGDAADDRITDRVLEGADGVVYCAGGATPAESDLDPRADLNATLPPLLAVLDALRHRPQVRLVVISSGGTVYGEPTCLPVPESHPLRPITSYGILKATAEHYLDLYRSAFGVDAVALRCGSVYGPGQVPFRNQGVVASLLACAQSGRRFTMYGDGTEVRDYVHVDDVVGAVLAISDHREPPPVINVGTGVGTPLRELIALAREVAGTTIDVRHAPRRPFDLHTVVLDVELLRAVMPFQPADLLHGLASTWASFPAVALPR